jgi:hypothetical protein
MFVLFSVLFACGDQTTDTSSEASEASDTAAEASPAEAALDTMEEYVPAYCSAYSMRCGGVYATQAECESSIGGMWEDKECAVTDTPLLEECISWLSEFPCDETGWIDACDNFYTCE